MKLNLDIIKIIKAVNIELEQIEDKEEASLEMAPTNLPIGASDLNIIAIASDNGKSNSRKRKITDLGNELVNRRSNRVRNLFNNRICFCV